MSKFEDHPTVQWWRDCRSSQSSVAANIPLNSEALKELCLKAGADDLGFVEISRPEIAES